MVLIFVLLFAYYVNIVESIEIVPGKPVPHADILDQLLSSNNIINASDPNDGSLFDFLFGNESDASALKLNGDNLDVSILDVDNVHKIVEVAKVTYQNNHRRQYKTSAETQHEAYQMNPFFVSKAFDMMQQSIYATRERLIATLPFQEKFKDDISYNIGILYGSLTQLIYKMDNMYAQMNNFPWRTHFIWYLILYEKILAGHVDATSMVYRMFEFQTQWIELMRPDEYGGNEDVAMGPPKKYVPGTR